MIDVVILGLVIGYCAFVVYKEYFESKNSCGHTCAGCSSASLCHIDFNQIYKEIKDKD